MLKQTRSEKIFDVFNVIILVLLCILMLYPVLYVFGRSAMSDMERAARPFAVIPGVWDFEGYKYILKSGSYITNAYMITILRTVIGTFLNTFFTAIFAYVISKKYYPLRLPLTAMVVFTMWFNGGLIPNFLLVRSLGLYNNFWVMIVPGLISVWNLLILRNFFAAIPDSLEESAKMDGANDMVILFRVILPLSAPAIATIALFYAVGHWNAWFDALIYINRRELWPIQVFLRELVRSVSAVSLLDAMTEVEKVPPSQSVVYSTIVVATLPILCVYPFIQKYFVKGVMVGSLKG